MIAETNSLKTPPSIVNSPAPDDQPTAQLSTSPPKSEPMRSLRSNPSNDTQRAAADEYEILCNDVVLPNNMTLAAVRHYVWRQGGELMMQYRRKIPPTVVAL